MGAVQWTASENNIPLPKSKLQLGWRLHDPDEWLSVNSFGRGKSNPPLHAITGQVITRSKWVSFSELFQKRKVKSQLHALIGRRLNDPNECLSVNFFRRKKSNSQLHALTGQKIRDPNGCCSVNYFRREKFNSQLNALTGQKITRSKRVLFSELL